MRLRFPHVFAALMGLSLLSAFLLPYRQTSRLQNVQVIFLPVTYPLRLIAASVRQPPAYDDRPRAMADMVAENQQLKVELANLTGQVETLQGLLAERERFGSIGRLCIPVRVIGSDGGARDAISLRGHPEVEARDPVLYPGGIAGRVERAGPGGAQVRLVTDRGFTVTARFGRFEDNGRGGLAFVPRETKDPILEGAGRGVMLVQNLQLREIQVAKIAENDWLVLDDGDWPPALKYHRLGRVVAIRPRPNAPLLAEIEVRPTANLMALGEVMVMTK